VGFRNAIAISSIIDGHSFRLSCGRAGYPLWSDYFDFYAFTATTDEELKASSVASTEVDLPGEFVGQRSPHLPSSNRISFTVDRPVLDGCLRNWIAASFRTVGNGRHACYSAHWRWVSMFGFESVTALPFRDGPLSANPACRQRLFQRTDRFVVRIYSLDIQLLKSLQLRQLLERHTGYCGCGDIQDLKLLKACHLI